MELLLRLAKESELDTVMEMYEDARSYEGCVWGDSYPDREILLYDYSEGNLYVYVSENKIIGAISVERDEALEKFKCWKIQDERRISFARVVIARDFLHQGYGKRMVEELLKILQARGHSTAQILVSPKNQAAMSVYRRLGFDFYDIVEAYGQEFYLCEKVFV